MLYWKTQQTNCPHIVDIYTLFPPDVKNRCQIVNLACVKLPAYFPHLHPVSLFVIFNSYLLKS